MLFLTPREINICCSKRLWLFAVDSLFFSCVLAGQDHTNQPILFIVLRYFSFSTPFLLFSVGFILTRNINVSSLLCCSVSLFPLSLSLQAPVPGPWRTFQTGPVSTASPCLRCCSLHAIYIVYNAFSTIDLVCWSLSFSPLPGRLSAERFLPVSGVLLQVSSC